MSNNVSVARLEARPRPRIEFIAVGDSGIRRPAARPASAPRGAQPDPDPPPWLPDPMPLVHNLTRCIFEIIIGARDLEQVARWVEPEVLAKMERRLTLERRARGVTGRTTIWPRVAFGTNHVERPSPDVVECVTVIRTPARSRALAMRLVGIDGRWRATEIALL